MRGPTVWRAITGSIGARLQLATTVAVLAVAALLTVVYVVESARIEDDRIDLLRSVGQSAASIAAGYEAQARAGKLTDAEAQAAAARAIGAIRYLGDNYVWINDMQVRIVMHPIKPDLNGKDATGIKDPNGKALFAAATEVVRQSGAGVVDYLWPRPGSAAPVPKLSYVLGFQPWGWVIGTGVYVDDLAAARWRMAWQLSLLCAATALSVGVAIWLLGRSVARPLHALATVTNRLADGDFSVAIEGAGRGDELGSLARALDVLKANAVERVRLEQSAASERAAKDRRQGAMDRLTQDFGTAISGVLTRLTAAARTMAATAREMTRDTERTIGSASDTADRSTTASRDLSTVAAATTELSRSVDEIARQVAHATTATRSAVTRATETDATFTAMSELAERIGDVGRAISTIAGQTNLLALNATIEAARAGEAGKGFAVVANEVKALAAQTTRATSEISEQVAGIRKATDQTTIAIREVGEAIQQVESVSAAIAAAVEQQGAATREIAANVQAVAQTAEQTSGAMASVVEIAGTTGSKSQTVQDAADDITKVADVLLAEVTGFLKSMACDDSERRRFERLPGRDVPASIRLSGQASQPVTISDISRGGAALRTQAMASAGTELHLVLSGMAEPLPARVVRCINGEMGITFRQDGATLGLVDAAMEMISRQQQRLAAAA